MLLFTVASVAASDITQSYREKVELHVGRTIYVAGEAIWYKAYANSNQNMFYSQAMYVELVNSKDRHVLGQILKIENGTAYSSIDIPDTLSTGQYRLIAYTNWMRNFSPEYFSSFPIVIYNQYDDKNNESIKIPHAIAGNSYAVTSGLSMSEIKAGNKVQIPVNKLIGSESDLTSASMSVYKQSPDMRPEIDSLTDSLVASKPQNELEVFSSKNSFAPETPSEFKFPAEDIGILYSGQLVNPENNSPITEVDVRMALEDSLAVMIASKTDSEGKFAFLLERTGQSIAYLDLYMRDSRLSGNYQIRMDEKFHYMADETRLKKNTGSGSENITSYLQDEAERVIIQRAFDKLDNTIEISDSDTLRKWHFYGKALIVVYPDIYFDLPNFEEISREILPRVRYNKNKKGCELAVIHIENGLRSDKPILLIDGIPTENYCVVYPLQSKDIERIEVQSGMRLSGNLEYNGLVAIYTSREYKLKNLSKESRSAYLINGYHAEVRFERNKATMTAESNQHTPDFQNLLYWNPILNSASTAEFFTSDEDAIYIIDFMGITSGGERIHTQMEFSVSFN